MIVDVLENDIPDIGLVVTEVAEPENGQCEVDEDGNVVFTPNEGFFGQDECACKLFYSCAVRF